MTVAETLATIDWKQVPEAEMVAFANALVSMAINRNIALWERIAGDAEEIDPTLISDFIRALPDAFGQVAIDG